MSTAFSRAPHMMEGPVQPLQHHAPNAALLIDFDNVTMGMRSDLSKELKNLLNSDVIRGKVTVQRAYADWRRYPQYIVPLSEASIDLIFAPAYGSSKKNATDIRMAIDGMELVFIRPEIGTYILLTGDSDFSSLVLKLKEYGKYVIGVGIQESSSDILVQNCDEYYSYTSLTGLRKTTDAATTVDPWVLVEKALDQMAKRKDVMRSDRLKQVMLEIDPGFDEGSFGFSKFSRFLSEASSKNLVRIKRLENGQYEVTPAGGRTASVAAPAETPSEQPAPRRSSGRGTRGGGRTSSSRSTPAPSSAPSSAPPQRMELVMGDEFDDEPTPSETTSAEDGSLQAPYVLLRRAIEELGGSVGGDAVRDSDIKRKMLAIDGSFDEAEHGFSKFSLFLRRAHDDDEIDLRKGESGNYEVELKPGSGTSAETAPTASAGKAVAPEAAPREEAAPAPREDTPSPQVVAGATAGGAAAPAGRRLNPRTSTRRRDGAEGPPPLLEGQAVGRSGEQAGKPAEVAAEASPAETAAKKPASRGRGRKKVEKAEAAPAAALSIEEFNLPTDPEAVVRYLTNSYAGVGKKTAESLVEAFGLQLFPVFHEQPERVAQVVPANRAEKVLEGWKSDFERRSGQENGAGAVEAEGEAAPTASEPEATAEARPARRGGRRTRGSSRG